jgi:hypothetical protein
MSEVAQDGMESVRPIALGRAKIATWQSVPGNDKPWVGIEIACVCREKTEAGPLV